MKIVTDVQYAAEGVKALINALSPESYDLVIQKYRDLELAYPSIDKSANAEETLAYFRIKSEKIDSALKSFLFEKFISFDFQSDSYKVI